LASPKFIPTQIPTRSAAPDHLVIDAIEMFGLAIKGSGMVLRVRTVWVDASGNVVSPGPSKDILGSDAAYLRDSPAWDGMERTILEELTSRGELVGTIS